MDQNVAVANNGKISSYKTQIVDTLGSWYKDMITNTWKLNIIGLDTNVIAANNGFIDKISTINNLQIIDTYAFDKNNNMKVGWIETIENDWYYTDTDIQNYGKIVKNQFKVIVNQVYYFDVNGKWISIL